MPSTRPQVMIFGTYHMDNPNLDYVKTNHADVLAEPRQAQIRDLLSRLETFASTHVAIEVPPLHMAKVNEQYQRYLQGEYLLTRNEVDQVGFRLAQAMGHSRLYGVDHHQDIHLDAVFQYVEAHGLTDVKTEFDAMLSELNANLHRLEAEGTVIDLLRYLNSPAHDDLHQLYLRSALVGAEDTWVGAESTASWYARNIKIYANIMRLVQSPDDRIFVLIGAGHATLLREFLRQTPQVELVHPQEYLA